MGQSSQALNPVSLCLLEWHPQLISTSLQGNWAGQAWQWSVSYPKIVTCPSCLRKQLVGLRHLCTSPAAVGCLQYEQHLLLLTSWWPLCTLCLYPIPVSAAMLGKLLEAWEICRGFFALTLHTPSSSMYAALFNCFYLELLLTFLWILYMMLFCKWKLLQNIVIFCSYSPILCLLNMCVWGILSLLVTMSYP